MKYFISLIVIASISSIIYGITIEDTEVALAHKFIGFGTAGLFVIAMPLFLFKESRGKKMKDYMLNEENIRKMQGKEGEKTEHQ